MRQNKKNKVNEIIPGMVFDKWTVLSVPYTKVNSKSTKTDSYVDVGCRCGVKSVCMASSLIKGRSRGCRSCARKRIRTDDQLKITSINDIYRDYKDSARIRGYEFKLSIEEFREFIFKNCFYCNSIPANIKKNKHTITMYNGIDRLDNNIGYLRDNCLTCCSICNTMKLDYPATDFLEHMKKIFKFHKFNKVNNPITEKKLIGYHNRAMATASQSHDIHTKVGALLLDAKTLAVTAEGYNGFIRGGLDNNLPTNRPEKYEYIIHAETNLLCNAVRSGVKTGDNILYCTLSPCVRCVRMLWQAGISEIYFKDKYKDFEESANMLDLEIATIEIGQFFKMNLSPKEDL